MIYQPTMIIAEHFDKKGINYHINETNSSSCVAAGYGIEGGPTVFVRFISRDNDNDVAVRVFSIINDTPKRKKLEMLYACSKINCEIRYAKFNMDNDSGDVNMEYDIPLETPDEAVGEICFEIFIRFCRILREEYHALAQVIYSDGRFKHKDELSELHEFFEQLKALRENPIAIDLEDSCVLDTDVCNRSTPSLDLDDAGWLGAFNTDDETV